MTWKAFIDSNQLWIGIVVGWLFTRTMEVLKRPKLTLTAALDKSFKRSEKEYKFLNIIINNKRQNAFQKFFYGNSTLNSARCWIIVKDIATGNEIMKINGRWATTKEPIDYSSGLPIIGDVLLPSRETIPQGEEASISIAIKDSSEEGFYLFNNESYLHNWKNPDFKLSEQRYKLEVLILSEGHEYKGNFMISNPSKSLTNFKLTAK